MIAGNLTSDYLIFFNNLKILEMAEFLTMEEAENKFGKKGRTNAALTLGIIGTALGALASNNGGCGCETTVVF